MKTINLVYPDKSDIPYKISKFPDGQQGITLDYKPVIPEMNSTLVEKVMIKSHFTSFKDLELIVATTAALRRMGVKEIHLYIPYLLGARSDREFIHGEASYLVDVIAPIINAQGFETVQVMDAHSDVAAACIKNLKPIDTYEFYKNFFDGRTDYILVSPDGGSLKKIYKVAEKIGYSGDIITCSKHRDTDGKLTRTHVPLTAENFSKDIIIIDDICDGGRTFINIIQAIKENWPTREAKNTLIVTHGIFSAGFEKLEKYFDTIYCTNSVKDTNLSIVTKEGFFKQFNVF